MNSEPFINGGEWNQTVLVYLEQSLSLLKFKSRLILANVSILTYDNNPFGIKAAGYSIELSFNYKDHDNLSPVIEKIKTWKEFTRYEKRFVVLVSDPISGSLSIFFNCGTHETPEEYMKSSRFKDHYIKVEQF